MRRLAASIIAYSGGETRSPDVRHALQGLLHFCMGESTQNRLTSTGRNPYNGNRNHVGQWNRSNFGMNNTEAFEFLLSWKDDVLMNCLSGRRDKLLIRRPCRRSGRPVPCWPRTGLSVRPVGHRPGDLPSGQCLVHRPAAQVLNRSDTKDAFIFHKRLTSCAICIIIKPSSVCSEKRAEQTRGSLFPFVCSALLFPLRKRACCDRQKIRRFLCWM